MIVYRQVHYSGRVQGVGFRYAVKQIATGYEVVGWVRNLPDGRVEIQAGGNVGELDAFLEAVAASHLASGIKEIISAELPPPQAAVSGFRIVH